MSNDPASTFHAPAARYGRERIDTQHGLLREHFIAHTLDALPVLTLLLNDMRQIVLANTQTLKSARTTMEQVLGKRPGEAFGCIHSSAGPGGCGTSEFCTRCGAVRSILIGLEGVKNVQECGMLRMGEYGVEALDLQVSSSPVEVAGESYVLFCIQDQSDFKRRRTLERLFFHDLLNTVGGLRGLMDMLRTELPERNRPDAEFIHHALSQLVDELLSQKDLMAAENNELTPVFVTMRSREVLALAARLSENLPQARGRLVRMAEGCPDVEFTSDATLVKRVLGNMVKNALEASRSGEEILLACGETAGGVFFSVANPSVMSEDVRLKVFKRNFSTKGLGRGLGTYGMKLLTERYLGGSVGFTTGEPGGTVFTLTLPLVPEKAGPSRPVP